MREKNSRADWKHAVRIRKMQYEDRTPCGASEIRDRRKWTKESTAEHRVNRLIIKISGATVHIVNIQLFLQ
jgi:hypothetical protein